MIKINDIKDPAVDLYDPEGNKVGTIETMLQFDDVRLQILKQEVSGYYVIWEGEKIEINKDSTLNRWPNGMFDVTEKMLAEMIHLRTHKRKQK